MGENRKDKTRKDHSIILLRIFRKYSEEPGALGAAAEFLRSLTFRRPRTIPYYHKHKYLLQLLCVTYGVLKSLEIAFDGQKVCQLIQPTLLKYLFRISYCFRISLGEMEYVCPRKLSYFN